MAALRIDLRLVAAAHLHRVFAELDQCPRFGSGSACSFERELIRAGAPRADRVLALLPFEREAPAEQAR